MKKLTCKFFKVMAGKVMRFYLEFRKSEHFEEKSEKIEIISQG